MCAVEIMDVIYWLLKLFMMNQAFSKESMANIKPNGLPRR
jgi:hypothetical protein